MFENPMLAGALVIAASSPDVTDLEPTQSGDGRSEEFSPRPGGLSGRVHALD
jgi:hypothetical protein